MNSNQSLSKIILPVKWIAAFATVAFVIYKLFYAYKINQLIHQVELVHQAYGIFTIIIALMCLNYFFEALKWQRLISLFENQQLSYAIKCVLTGISLNIITPNQLGDFIGRGLFLNNISKLKGGLVTFINHTPQLMVTVIIGVWGFIVCGPRLKIFPLQWVNYLQLAWLIVVLVLLLSYANLYKLSRVNLGKKLNQYVEVFGWYNSKKLWYILALSAARYAVFLYQYLLCMQLFQVELSLAESVSGIAAVLFLQSFAPGFLLAEIGLRGVSTLIVFESLLPTSQIPHILMVTYSVWIINVLLPGIVGWIYIINYKAKKA